MSDGRVTGSTMVWRIFAVGVGSNLGDRRGQIDRASELLGRTPGVRNIRCGPLLESAPVLPAGETTPHPDYLNTVFGGETCLHPRAVLSRLLAIESGFGRRRASVAGREPSIWTSCSWAICGSPSRGSSSRIRECGPGTSW